MFDCDVFGQYAKNQELAVRTIERLEHENLAFRAFLELARANPVCKRLPLAGFLIKPIQRSCKLPLLFNEIIKCLPEGDAEREAVGQVAEKIKGMLDSVNEHISAFQKIETLKSEITGGIGRDDIDALFQSQAVIRDAVLSVKGANPAKRKEISKMTVVLMEDSLVLAHKGPYRQKRTGGGGGPIILALCALFIVEPKVKDEVGYADGGTTKNTVEVTDLRSRHKFVLMCESYLDKLTWFQDLTSQVAASTQRYAAEQR
jgi:hypothetical protein